MNESRREPFVDFVRREGGTLIDAIGGALDAEFAIQDHLSRHIVGTKVATPAQRIEVDLDGEHLGTLVVNVDRPEVARLASVLAQQLRERFLLEHDLDRMTDRLSICYDELNLMFQLTDSTEADATFADKCRRQLHDTASITGDRNLVLYLEAEGVVEAAKGDSDAIDPEIEWLIQRRDRLARIRSELVARWEADEGHEAIRLQGAAAGQFGMLSYVVVPLAARGSVRGFVGIFNAPGCHPPRTGDVRLVECLARQLSSSATTHDLVLELQDVLFNTVRALVATIDAKDPYTRGHSERVYKLSIAIGEAMGLPSEELQVLAWSALLHDIGKIAIPNEILRKPDRLTPHEYEVIKTHPERGCRVIEEIPQFRGALDGIRHHHERFDGKGYPGGLSGYDIPLMGRIIGVADTYDAMVTSRAYRSARAMEDAIQEIRDSSGTQLDPDIVEVFLHLVEIGRVTAPADDSERKAA